MNFIDCALSGLVCLVFHFCRALPYAMICEPFRLSSSGFLIHLKPKISDANFCIADFWFLHMLRKNTALFLQIKKQILTFAVSNTKRNAVKKR